MIMKVRKENENLVFTPVEDDRNYSIPTAFFEAAYPNYAAEEDEEKQD
jgi:hypothetical protein